MRGARAAVVIWLLTLAACAWRLHSGLVVTTDLGAFLPPAATRAQQVLIGQLREGAAARLLLIGIDGPDERALAELSRALARRLDESGAFAIVANGDPARTEKARQLLLAQRYALSPGVTPQRFTAEGLRAALQEELEFLASPFGLAARHLLPADPTGEWRRLASSMTGSSAPALRHGVWFTPDGRRALLVAETRAAGFDIDAQERAARLVRDQFAAIATSATTLELAGAGLAAVLSRSTIERDAEWASLVSAAGVLLILFAVYRSALPVALSALPAVSGLLVGVAAVSVWYGPVHGITLGFGAILIGETVDYPTYLYAHVARGETLADTLRRIGPTLRLAVLTTACGALAMLLSSFRGLAQLGLLTLVGVAVAGLVTRWVLPALTPARALQRKLAIIPMMGDGLRPCARAGTWIAVSVLVASATVLFTHRDRVWNDDLAALSPLPEDLKRLDAELRGQLGAPGVRHLVVIATASREAALEKSEAAANLLDQAVAERWIGGYDLAARYLPSRRTQEQRRAALPDSGTLAANLAQAAQGLPFRGEIFAPFLADVERARHAPWIDADTWRDSAIAFKLRALLASTGDGWLAFAPLTGVQDAEALGAAVRGIGDANVFLLDLKQEADTMVAGYRMESIRLCALGLLCIVVLVYAGLGRVGSTLRVLVPVLAAALLDIATLVAMGERLTVVHLVALLLVVGVGLNYALFFGRRAEDPEDRQLTWLSLIVASLATLCASLALAFCATPVLRAIGLTIALGTAYAFTLAALLAPHATRVEHA